MAVDGDSLGHAVEASHAALTGLSDTEYPGIHNRGHGMFGSVPGGQGFGVMNVPAVAIRDPVFWRWHKHIDTISTAWQETQPPYGFTDTPRVVIRDALSGAAANWTSPDVLLVSTAGLPAGADPAALVTAAMGGASFDTPVPTGPLTGADGLVVVDELTTRMQQSSLSDGRTVVHLTHDPFAVVVRVRNLENRPSAITLRIFLVPEQLADDRSGVDGARRAPRRGPDGRAQRRLPPRHRVRGGEEARGDRPADRARTGRTTPTTPTTATAAGPTPCCYRGVPRTA